MPGIQQFPSYLCQYHSKKNGAGIGKPEIFSQMCRWHQPPSNLRYYNMLNSNKDVILIFHLHGQRDLYLVHLYKLHCYRRG